MFLTPMRALIVAAIVLAIVVFVAKLMSAQVTPAPRHRIATDFVEETAKAATDDDPQSVRRFVDEIFNRSMFAKAPASVRDRVFRSELAFRNGRHVAIAEDTLRETINEFARRADAPGHVKTSEGQLHIFREGMRRWIPHFAGPKPTPHGLGIEMSPAEAVFIAMHLAQQKLTNPEYQVDADEWVKRANARKANGLPSQRRADTHEPVLSVQHHGKDTAAVYWALDNDLAEEASDLVHQIHGFLDRSGFQR